jgi:hypothetical protein
MNIGFFLRTAIFFNQTDNNEKKGAVMKRRLSQAIGYLFIPEDSVGQKAPTLVASPARKSFAGVSLKAAFWAGMAVAVALMLGRLS